MKLSNKLFATLLVGLFMSSAAFAQTGGNDTITATTQVVTAITVTGVDNLQFGSILASPAGNTAIAPTSASAGSFDISGGVASLGVDLTFTLPTQLDSTTPDGSPTPITITFSGTDAGRNIVDTQGGQTAFDPNSTHSTTLNGSGGLFIWLGGTITNAGAPFDLGTYNGTVTLAVDYN